MRGIKRRIWTWSSPQPPHVPVLIWEKAVGVVAAVLDVVKSAAVDSVDRVSRSGTGESVHERPIVAVIAAAFGAHSAAGGPKTEDSALRSLRAEGKESHASSVRSCTPTKRDGGTF